MKIAQVCHRYYPYIGGVETRVEEISKRLVRKGFDVEVLTNDPSGKLTGAGACTQFVHIFIS